MVRGLSAFVFFSLLVFGACNPAVEDFKDYIERSSAEREVCVAIRYNVCVMVFDAAADGNVALLRTFESPDEKFRGFNGIAADITNNEIIATNANSSSIGVFSRTASSRYGNDVMPLRVISGPSTMMYAPESVAVDTVNNEILASNIWNGSITVYPRTADGDVSPLRTISGLFEPQGIAVDTVNNEIFVTDPLNNSLTVYSRTANGTVSPLRTISGASSLLNQPVSVAVDTVNNELFVVNQGDTSITVYSRSANGNVPPLRRFQSWDTRGLGVFHGIAIDTTHNEIFITGIECIGVFSRTADGKNSPQAGLEMPLRRICGPLQGQSYMGNIAVCK